MSEAPARQGPTQPWGPPPVRDVVLSPGAQQAAREATQAKKDAKAEAKPKEEPKKAPEPVKAAEEAPKEAPKPELLSPKLAKLAHRERVLLERETAAKKTATDAAEAVKKAKEEARAETLAAIKAKGLKYLLEDAGLSVDEVAKQYLETPPPLTPAEKKLAEVESKVDQALKANEEATKASKEREIAEANAKYQAINATIQREIKTAISDEKKYPEIHKRLAVFRSDKNKGSVGAVGYIYDIIVDAWETGQKVVTPEEVANKLESLYSGAEVKAEEPGDVEAPKKPRRPLSAARAVAATSPIPPSGLTREQRHERAMAVLAQGRKR